MKFMAVRVSRLPHRATHAMKKTSNHFLKKLNSSDLIVIVPIDESCNQKTITNLRLRLLSNPKLVILLTGHATRHAHIGRAPKRSCEGIPVPGLGRE
jgi:RNase P/RNase MRP subunit p30